MIAEDDHEPVGSKLPSRTVDRVTEAVLHRVRRWHTPSPTHGVLVRARTGCVLCVREKTCE